MPAFRSKNAAVLIFLAAFFAVSCASAPHRFECDPLSILGADAPWYAVVPVTGNCALMEAVSARFADPDAFLKNLDRADTVYCAGVNAAGQTAANPGQTAAAGSGQSAANPAGSAAANPGPAGSSGLPVTMLVTGSFPKKIASLAFPSGKGWQKAGSRSGGYWYRNGRNAAAIPRSGLICFTDPEYMPDLLNRIQQCDSGAVPVDPLFRLIVEDPDTSNSTIAVYLSDRGFISQYILGNTDIRVPVDSLMVTAEMDTQNDGYLLSFRFTMADERSARALVPLLRLALGVTALRDGSVLVVKDIPRSPRDLADLLEFMYF